MNTLKNKDYSLISGGSPLVIGAEAIIIGVGIYSGPDMIANSTPFWNNIGSNVGEWVYETTHPNVLGQMEFGPGEFGHSYIVPAFPDSYFG
jgi:hypothetical protein